MKELGLKKPAHPNNLPPGTIVYTGSPKNKASSIRVVCYNKTKYQEHTIVDPTEITKLANNSLITWVSVIGLNDTNILEKIGELFNIHSLVLEDIANINQRPKYEEFDDFVFFTSKIMGLSPSKKIKQEQISIIFNNNILFSFQEREPDVFKHLNDRLKNDKGRVRKMGTDYLAYLLLDHIIDSYFLLLENAGTEIEKQEERVLAKETKNFSEKNHFLKKNVLILRKNIWPQRELISMLQRSLATPIKKQTRPYINDAYEHVIQIIDTIDNFRDILSGLHDLHLTNLSNRLNETMKLLTVFSTIFIPLTFIAGIYGMNFKYMPELNTPYAYPLLLFIMLSIAVGMLLFFKKKKWL